MILKKIYNFSKRMILNPDERFWFLASLGLLSYVPDDIFLKKMYRHDMGRDLNLENPTTYTEKLQWLKLYDRQPIYTTMVDKYAAKTYVKNMIGEEYVIPCLGVWDSFDDINFDELPEQFVLKCTHDSGTNVVCKNKNEFDKASARKLFKKRLKRVYFNQNREWPYKNVTPRIIAETYMEDKQDGELRDYKFFTFNGIPKVLYIAQGRGKDGQTVADFFDMNFEHLPFTIDHDMAADLPHPPQNFNLMKNLAAKLSEGTPQLRVDFYEVNEKVYFGEMTFFHCSGLTAFHPEEWDKIFGDWVVLPERKL